MINFWKLAYKSVKEQRDELQLQNIGLKKELNYRNKSYTELFEAYEKLERENNNLKQSVSEYKDYAESHVANYLELKALEHENEQLKEENEKLKDKLKD